MRAFGRPCLVVVAALAVFAGLPVSAEAYYDPAKPGYDIDVGDVGVGAVYENDVGAAWLLDRHQSLGPHSVRQGWPITTAASAMDGLMVKYNARGLRPLVLASFGQRDQPGTQAIPTDAQVATFCRDVSERFGPGGGQMDDANSIKYIELGNETTYDAVARTQGGEYARRVRTCAQNVRRGVKVLAQGPSDYATYAADRPEQRWIDDMYMAVPDLNSYRGGWTIHPYGPDDNELDNLQADLGARDTSGEYFLTEYGIATDDGRACLGGGGGSTYNNGWPCTITYAQAATGFQTTINRWMNKYPRIRALWWYQIADQRDPGQTMLRENYYGLFQNAAYGRGKDPLRRKVELYIRDQDDLAPDTKPETTLTAGPSGLTSSTSASFEFSSSQGGSSFECRLDSTPFGACTSPKSYAALAEGGHTFEVRAINLAENTDPTPASRAFTVDATPPQTVIDSGPSGATDDATPTFAFSSSEPGSSFQCRIDAAAFGPCSSPHTTAPLSEGQHTFEARAIDAAGNPDPTPAGHTITVDTAAPTPPPQPQLPPTPQPPLIPPLQVPQTPQPKPAPQAGKCSKLKGKKRVQCIKKRCGKLKGKKKKTCAKKVTRLGGKVVKGSPSWLQVRRPLRF